MSTLRLTLIDLTIIRAPWPASLEPALADCIEANLPWLQTDHHPHLTTDQVLENLADDFPNVWVAVATVNEKPTLLAASSLTYENPSTFSLHGISATWLRKTPYRPRLIQAINNVTLAALEAAFEEHDCRMVLATIHKNNIAAKGFCWRLGFKKSISKTLNTLTYEISTSDYYQRLRPQLYRSLVHP